MAAGKSPDILQALYGTFIVRGIATGNRVQFEEMNRAIEANNIQPFVDKVFKFEDAVDAYKHLEGQNFTGKVVIEMD
jgi:NADPH:quinone reductase-like Zn-dependent oxidoreductase